MSPFSWTSTRPARTALLAREFGAALADAVAVLDVYPARERGEDHQG
jgi:hypothetical protein